MELEVAHCLSAFKIGLDDHVFECLSPSRKSLELLLSDTMLNLFVFFLVLHLDLLDEVFDLLLGESQVVTFSFTILILEGDFLHEHCIWVCQVWELQSSRLTYAGCMEIDSQISPISFT
jgi:hypothetical protein